MLPVTGEHLCCCLVLLHPVYFSHLAVVRQADFVAHPCSSQLGLGLPHHADFGDGVNTCRMNKYNRADARRVEASPTIADKIAVRKVTRNISQHTHA